MGSNTHLIVFINILHARRLIEIKLSYERTYIQRNIFYRYTICPSSRSFLIFHTLYFVPHWKCKNKHHPHVHNETFKRFYTKIFSRSNAPFNPRKSIASHRTQQSLISFEDVNAHTARMSSSRLFKQKKCKLATMYFFTVDPLSDESSPNRQDRQRRKARLYRGL